jgi:hypothetical protein
MVALAAATTLGAVATQAAARPSFSTTPALSPSFLWDASDYVVRCTGDPVHIRVKVSGKWQGKTGASGYRSSSFGVDRRLTAGTSFVVSFRGSGGGKPKRFHVRCLPPDFPAYESDVVKPRGPRFFVMQLPRGYVAIYDRHGVPVWWIKADGSPYNAELLPDGGLAWAPIALSTLRAGDYEIRTLKNKLVRTVKAANGYQTDQHELLQLANGNFVLAGWVYNSGVDTTPFGGASNATLVGVQVQELTPSGKIVWKWNSTDHIGLEQTGSGWWPQFILPGGPLYDVSHWNSVEPAGPYYLLSFRHLDAVYAISRKSGKIAWKLGGTRTARSLTILNDPQGSYPFSGQHDARLLPDGTLSIYDNNTLLGKPPRVVRYRLDPTKRTAKLIQSISDPEVTNSICCGSARLLPSGNWLINWGGTGVVGGYSAKGERFFKLTTPGAFSYRANPVPPGALTARQLRRAMDAINR